MNINTPKQVTTIIAGKATNNQMYLLAALNFRDPGEIIVDINIFDISVVIICNEVEGKN